MSLVRAATELDGDIRESWIVEVGLATDGRLCRLLILRHGWMGVVAMLGYIYNINYLTESLEEAEARNWFKLESLAHVYVTAQKYGLDGLKKLTGHPMERILGARSEVRGPEQSFDLKEVLRIVWPNTSSEDQIARPLLARYCAGRLKELRQDSEFVQMMNSTPELATAVSFAMLDISRNGKHGSKRVVGR